ncbi:MAG: molybdopterin-dependent oxidoreductase [Pyrinomonadaceae bacterium]
MSEEKLENKTDENEDEISTEAREIVEAKTDANDKENTAKILNENMRVGEPVSDVEAKKFMSYRSRRDFLIGGAAAVLGYLGYSWLREPERNYIFTDTFRFNEKVSQLYYSPKNLAPEFSAERITEARVNGSAGLGENFDSANWALRVGGLKDRTEDLILTLDDIKQLPRIEMTTELKCIEGWSIIVKWAGARFSDFAEKYQPQFTKYVSLVTPDEGYYVGWDMPSILHPQTLLAYEINGTPLPPEHGAPLRIASPTKYGIKQIKRIGRIEFTDERPKDYWAERGYDWYSGH